MSTINHKNKFFEMFSKLLVVVSFKIIAPEISFVMFKTTKLTI